MTKMSRATGLFRLFLACAAVLWLASQAGAKATIQDEAGPMSDTCALSGGTASLEGSLFQCCWPGWGCLKCAVVGDGNPPSCWMNCSSPACEKANSRVTDHPQLPKSVKNPEQFFGGSPNTLAPPPTTKTPKADPGAGTVQ